MSPHHRTGHPRTTRRRLGALRALAGVVVLAVVAGACASGARLPDAVSGTPETPADDSVSFPPCTDEQAAAIDPVASYDPLPELPDPGGPFGDAFMQSLVERGTIRVGVSPDTLLFGSRNLDYVADNPDGDLPYEGFDVDILVEVALAVFGGTRSDIGEHIEFVAMPFRDRLPKLQSGEVDLVAHTMTINCSRWLQIAFTAEYFTAGQRVLVLRDSPYRSIDDIVDADATICVPAVSTSEQTLIERFPDLDRRAPVDTANCLVLLQQGEVDAITSDDTVMAGLAAQDPATVVVGEQFTTEPYGLGAASENVEFIRFVNRVLEDMIADGRWAELYEKWLVPGLTTSAPEPPARLYGRPLS
ncbi:MAG: glutamate ABC transporter substrate-binding protein [Acidimicrobiales bacterium]